ncbi:MAG TPA: hypothetical protein VMZ91_02120 [Candidatus Paceibacterota bacterium]|nr:hypothetical protein [Candidatus Paceibacterota bacterium]
MEKKEEKSSEKKEDKISKKNIKIKKFGSLEGKFLLVKVGSKDEKASTEQIKKIEDQLIDLFEKNDVNCLAFVTHHLVSMEIVEDKKNKK